MKISNKIVKICERYAKFLADFIIFMLSMDILCLCKQKLVGTHFLFKLKHYYYYPLITINKQKQVSTQEFNKQQK